MNKRDNKHVIRVIKSELALSGFSQTDISKIVGVHVAAVNAVVNGKRKNPRIREAIADAVGKSVDELWPPQTPSSEQGKTEGREQLVPPPGCRCNTTPAL